MESFYAIVYCQIRATADEKVSLGLLMRSGNGIIFRYSHDKLAIVKLLLPEPAYRLLKANLRNMENYFTGYNDIQSRPEAGKTLFGDLKLPNVEPPAFLNSDYIHYLNTYSTNLLTFSKPYLLTLEQFDNGVFESLYHEFIYESDQVLEHGITIYERVKNKVNPLIRSHVNIDVELTPQEVPELVLPTKVWFIGQNKVDVTGEIFDFQKKTYFLKNEIASHLNLIHALQTSGKGAKGTHFLVGKEPSKKLRDNHAMWNSIRNLKYITFVPTGELQQINDYVVKHKVEPFVKQSPLEDEESPF